MPHLMRQPLLPTVLVSLLFSAGLVAVGFSSPAAAETCAPPAQSQWNGTGYSCVIPGGPGEPEDPDGGGEIPGEPAPPCPLQEQADGWADNYSGDNASVESCTASSVCIVTDFHPPYTMPEGEKPNEDSEAKLRLCFPGGYGPPSTESFWTDEGDEPTLAEQAQEAVGNIDLGTADVAISPTTRTLVNLDTWFWLDGDVPDEAVGSSAFGLRAIATFRSMTVDTGDGGSFTCPYVTSRSEAEESCTYTYRRSSRAGTASVDGRAAFTTRITTVYDLSFEVDGRAIPSIPGAPTTLDGPAADANLRVDEVQSLVKRLG